MFGDPRPFPIMCLLFGLGMACYGGWELHQTKQFTQFDIQGNVEFELKLHEFRNNQGKALPTPEANKLRKKFEKRIQDDLDEEIDQAKSKIRGGLSMAAILTLLITFLWRKGYWKKTKDIEVQ